MSGSPVNHPQLAGVVPATRSVQERAISVKITFDNAAEAWKKQHN